MSSLSPEVLIALASAIIAAASLIAAGSKAGQKLVDGLTDENDRLRERLGLTEEGLADLRVEFKTSQHENETLRVELDTLRGLIEQLRREKLHADQLVESLRERTRHLEDDLNKLMAENTRLRDAKNPE